MKNFTQIFATVLFIILHVNNLNSQEGFSDEGNEPESTEVGTLPGQFGVSPTGAATYTIPLDLPQGRANMTPTLSLNYNSQGGEGVLGKGWGIGGWSYIERTRETIYYNGNNASLDFANDDFLLDGQHLILISSTDAENEYRTEVDRISKVIMKDASSNAAYFEVHLKNGMKQYYGKSADSRQVSVNNGFPPIRYHLNKIEDTKGNYIKYEYEQNASTGELYMLRIKYTLPVEDAQGYEYVVHFNYEQLINDYHRTSFIAHGSSNYKYMVKKNLTSIDIKYNNNTVKKYHINYSENGIFDTKPYLTSIELEGRNGTKLNPTVFQWECFSDTLGNPIQEYTGPVVEDYLTMNFFYGSGDFNLDGLTDIVESGITDFTNNTGGTYLRLGGQLGSTPILINETIYGDPNSFFGLDVDGNGGDELIIFDAVSEIIYCYKFEPNGNSLNPILAGQGYGELVAQGDFTGDGINDIIVNHQNGNIRIYEGNEELTQFSTPPVPVQNFPLSDDDYIFRNGDFNADGVMDFAAFREISEDNYVFDIYTLELDIDHYELQNLNFEIINIPLTNIELYAFDIGDFNGDQKSDLLLTLNFLDTKTTETYVFYSDGNSWLTQNLTLELEEDYYLNGVDGGHIIMDFNNDGISDIGTCSFYSYNDKIWVFVRKFIKYPGVTSGFRLVTREIEKSTFGDWEEISSDGFVFGDFSGRGQNDLFLGLIYFESNHPQISESRERAICYSQRIAYTARSRSLAEDHIISATNGLGATQSVGYSKFSQQGYEATSFPVVPHTAPLFVACSVVTHNPGGGFLPSVEYSYKGLQAHAQGKGLLGFQQQTETYNRKGTKKNTDYQLYTENGNYFYRYPETIEIIAISNQQTLSSTTNILNHRNFESEPGTEKIFFPFIEVNHTVKKDLNGIAVRTKKIVQEHDQFDPYGNSLKIVELVEEGEIGINLPNSTYGWQKTTERLFSIPDETNWIVNRPTYTKITEYYDQGNPTTNITEVNLDYYNTPKEEDWPLLKTKENIPNRSTDFTTKVEYNYDVYGNLISEITKAPNDPTLNDRIVEYEYKTIGGYDARFLTKKTIHAPGDNHVTEFSFNLATTNMESSKDIRGLITTYQYSDMGNLEYVLNPDGTINEHLQSWSTGNPQAPIGSIYYTYDNKKIPTLRQDWGKTIVFYDELGRARRKVTSGMNQSEYIYVDIDYDNYGRVSTVTEPYFSSESPQFFTSFTYDDLGRLDTETRPDGTVISTNYNGRETTVSNQTTGQWKRNTMFAVGITEKTENPAGTVQYNYDGAKRLVWTNAHGSITNIQYDAAGNKWIISEPNSGTSTFTHNAFGEIIQEEDGEGNEYSMQYDDAGRLLTRHSLQQDFALTTFSYINSDETNGFGQIQMQSISPPVSETAFVDYIYTYDEKGRLITKTENIAGESFTFSYQYNPDHGQLEYTTYPTGFQTRNKYNQRGFLHQVLNNQQVIWQANTMNQRGQLTDFEFGNGITTTRTYDDFGYPETIFASGIQYLQYDFNSATGNLTNRRNYMSSQYFLESYNYDNVLKSRLESWEIGGLNPYTIQYNNNDNIKKKSDVTLASGQFQYRTRPHAVSGIAGATAEYIQKADEQLINFTPFNKVNDITQAWDGGPYYKSKKMKFAYGPGNLRKRTQLYWVAYNNNELLKETKYFIGKYELEQKPFCRDRHLHYLVGGDGVFAIYEEYDEMVGQIFYIHKNYLGSYDVITDESGRVVERLNFDPWGRRRNPNTGQVLDGLDTKFSRGFTGHEHLDDFNLINMNGRLFDPVLARFISPDPIVQAPGNGQNHNRYSYALNNPLKYTDPSGYSYKPNDWDKQPTFNPFLHPGAGGTGLVHFGNTPGSYYYSGGNYYNGANGNLVSYQEVYANYVVPNAHATISGPLAGNVFRDWSNGMNIYAVEAFGGVTMVSAFGDIGETIFSANGGISFSNPTAGAYLSGGGNAPVSGDSWVSVQRNQIGGGDENIGISFQEVGIAVGAFGIVNEVKANLVEWGMRGTEWGMAGAKYLKYVKRAGTVGFVVNVGISGYGSYDYYYNQNGTNWQVGAKATLDVAMGAAAFVWPIGTAISGVYFIIDASTAGFGGWGDPYNP